MRQASLYGPARQLVTDISYDTPKFLRGGPPLRGPPARVYRQSAPKSGHVPAPPALFSEFTIRGLTITGILTIAGIATVITVNLLRDDSLPAAPSMPPVPPRLPSPLPTPNSPGIAVVRSPPSASFNPPLSPPSLASPPPPPPPLPHLPPPRPPPPPAAPLNVDCLVYSRNRVSGGTYVGVTARVASRTSCMEICAQEAARDRGCTHVNYYSSGTCERRGGSIQFRNSGSYLYAGPIQCAPPPPPLPATPPPSPVSPLPSPPPPDPSPPPPTPPPPTPTPHVLALSKMTTPCGAEMIAATAPVNAPDSQEVYLLYAKRDFASGQCETVPNPAFNAVWPLVKISGSGPLSLSYGVGLTASVDVHSNNGEYILRINNCIAYFYNSHPAMAISSTWPAFRTDGTTVDTEPCSPPPLPPLTPPAHPPYTPLAPHCTSAQARVAEFTLAECRTAYQADKDPTDSFGLNEPNFGMVDDDIGACIVAPIGTGLCAGVSPACRRWSFYKEFSSTIYNQCDIPSIGTCICVAAAPSLPPSPLQPPRLPPKPPPSSPTPSSPPEPSPPPPKPPPSQPPSLPPPSRPPLHPPSRPPPSTPPPINPPSVPPPTTPPSPPYPCLPTTVTSITATPTGKIVFDGIESPLGVNPAQTYDLNIPGLIFSAWHDAGQDVNTGATCETVLGGNLVLSYDGGWYTNSMSLSFTSGCGVGDTVTVADAGGTVPREQNFRALVFLSHC